MPNDATIVAASLSKDALEKSIKELVANVNNGLGEMETNFNATIGRMEQKLKSLGQVKVGSGDSSDGGATRRTRSQQAETQAVKETTTSYDQLAKAQQVALRSASGGFRNADTLQMMQTNLDLLREKLREARQQYSSFVALAAQATTTGDKGLYQFAAAGVHQYEQEVKSLIPQIRTLQSSIQQMGDVIAPQGHTIQNYVNSIGKANPELKQLGEQIKNNSMLMQSVDSSTTQATTSAHRYTEEIRKQAQAIRETQQWKEKGYAMVGDRVYYDPERSVAPAKNRLSLEEQILNVQKEQEVETIRRISAEKQEAAEKAATEQEARRQLAVEAQITQEQAKRSQPKSFASYDDLRQSIAHVLGLQQSQVKLADTETASYNNLDKTLKQLKQTYDRLTASERNSEQGKALVASMHEVQRAMQRIQTQAARPISLESIIGINGRGGLAEKTLDDIAYKMQRLSSLRSGLDVNAQRNEINQINAEYNRLKKKMDEVMQKNQQMIGSNNTLGRSWNYMKNRLAFYVTVGASTSFIKNLIEVRSQYEMNERALGILLDSASRGTRIFNELSQMSLVSPYTLIELSNAAKQLTAYDIAAKDVVDTTRRLADMASAVGVPVERLTYALGQIKAYGYLNSRDARMFANAGIPLVKQLADYYSELEGKMVSTADVYDRMKKKAIDYSDVMKVVNKMTDEGGKFFDFQTKMADTLKVRLANLTLAWNNMLNDLGKDSQGALTGGIKSLTVMFRHWREIQRVLWTVIAALGAYKVASMLAGLAASRAVSSTIPAWFRLASTVRTTQGNMALLGLTMRSIPFTAWVTAIATLTSYFYLFNNSSDSVKQKLDEIKNAFDGIRKEATDLFADAIKSDNIGSQLTKLRDMLELAQTEMGVTIPINLEDVDESNIKQKLKEAKQFIDDYINFSQTFSEAAAGTKFNELMNDFGASARSTYTSISESINTVVIALQELVDKGNASKRDIEILNELISGQKDDESRIEYLQRLVSIYEELGLLGQKKTTPKISFFGSSESNIEELEQQQSKALDRLGIKNKEVYASMLTDVQDFYSSSSIASYQFEQQVMRVAKKIDINNIPVEQRTMKLSAAINEEASLNNWNQFEKEFARQIANEKFGTNITISEESKSVTEEELHEWQKRQQDWMDKHGIDVKLNFQTNDTEISYAKRMLQAAKDAQEEVAVQRRKLAVGTGSQESLDAAIAASKKAREEAKAAGADLEQLDKKSNAAAKRAQKAAESELQKALKEELQLIDKVRSAYKDLTKEGESRPVAIEKATTGFEESVANINKTLAKFGIAKLDLKKFAGITNPRELVNLLQEQLDKLLTTGAAKPAEIQDLQVKIRDLNLDAEKYDLTMITKGLNNELDKLKDEYELAVELDANPELGNMFMDLWGINEETLPHTAQEYASRYTKALNKYLAEHKKDLVLPNLLNVTSDDMAEFQKLMEAGKLEEAYFDLIKKGYEATHEARQKETTDAIKNWDKLLEKYSEYQYKLKKIQDDANKERKDFVMMQGTNEQKSLATSLFSQINAATDEDTKNKLIAQLKQLVADVAGSDEAKIQLTVAIDKREAQESARTAFEEFQKSPEWILATGDLAGMTDKAIGGLINRLEQYKKSAKNLDPKQVKQMNNALKNLYKQQRQGNPFAAIINAFTEAKERAAEFTPKIEEAEKELSELENNRDQSKLSETADRIKKLKDDIAKWKEEQKNAGKVSATTLVDGINSAIAVAQQATGIFTDMMSAIGNEKAVRDINRVFSVIDKAGQGAAIGAQIGQGYGAIIGAAVGGLSGLVTTFADQWSGNAAITERIQDSERAVKRLENAYIDLEQAVDKAYGTAIIGARQATLANKELQLAEIQRQIELEKSRKAKNRDEDKILDLQKQYKELFYEIQNGYREIVDDLMGTDVASFAENLVSSMIDAFKQGEDYMKVFSDKFDEMIDNMIMKSIVSRVVAQYMDALWEDLDTRINERSKKEQEEYAKKQDFNDYVKNLSDEEIEGAIALRRYWVEGDSTRVTQEDIDAYRRAAEEEEKAAKMRLDAANAFTDSDIDFVMSEINNIMPELGEKLKNILGEYYQFGESSEQNLSALSQGISSISEPTAQALEAYANSMSQQAYLRNELLAQIRDAIIGTNNDIGLGVQAQMLLQLQNNYIIMQSMQSMMEGWSTPSGQGIRVELIS